MMSNLKTEILRPKGRNHPGSKIFAFDALKLIIWCFGYLEISEI